MDRRRQPVGDRRGLGWIGHRDDLVEALLVSAADAFMLAEVFVPGADDELFKDAAGIGRIAPHPPADGARASPGAAPGVQGHDEVPLEPRPGPVLNRDLNRPVGRRRTEKVRGRPVTCRQQVRR